MNYMFGHVRFGFDDLISQLCSLTHLLTLSAFVEKYRTIKSVLQNETINCSFIQMAKSVGFARYNFLKDAHEIHSVFENFVTLVLEIRNLASLNDRTPGF